MNNYALKKIDPAELVKKITPKLLAKIDYEAMLLRKKPEEIVRYCGYFSPLRNR